ncbi:ABC transporter ATP-binding protein [Robertmurraya sp. P23]|uniref:ABC transporter ATP-binding protein n=1 Tax=Robertmurraya sp. P23 TaxID=3436931 RepID=UPI003D9A07FF
MKLTIQNVKKNFNDRQILKGINLHIKNHEFICVLGHSGCGKSTLLNLIAGFTQPDEGVVIVDNEIVREPSKERGVVFQEHALFPWYTVLENISFGPIVQGADKETSLHKAKKYLNMIGLDRYENHYPSELSGGMKQRVGIARALAGEPKLLLMDEPFGALDVFTRENMRNELIDIWKKLETTIIFITHDISEAICLADRIIVMKDGQIARDVSVKLPRPRKITESGFGELMTELEQTLVH